MTDEPAPERRGRRQLLLVALLFLAPLATAVFLYYGGNGWRPGDRSNHGALLSPVINLLDARPGSALGQRVEGYWALVYVNEGECELDCRDALYTLRQSRLMLGKEMNRVQRVFLHGSDAPDTVILDREHQGLVALREPASASLLQRSRPAGAAQGGFFLLDPLGNLVMYFPPDVVPRDMVDDVAHLLELSHIG